MLAQATCPNCGTTNPTGKVFCVLCGKPIPPTQPIAGIVGQGVPASQATTAFSAAPHIQQAYVAPTYSATQQIPMSAPASRRAAPRPARRSERTAINALEAIGWFWLLVSLLIAAGILFVGLNTVTELTAFSNVTVMSHPLVPLILASALVVVLQGFTIWAAAYIGASVARSLIVIRMNTA